MKDNRLLTSFCQSNFYCISVLGFVICRKSIGCVRFQQKGHENMLVEISITLKLGFSIQLFNHWRIMNRYLVLFRNL